MVVGLASAKAANAATKFAYKPTALFVGATSGIGQGAAETFARYTEGNANIFISGRNETSARSILSKFPTPSDPSTTIHEFIQCDAKLMKNVVQTVREMKETYKVQKLNYLFVCQGAIEFITKFTDNGEGIDKRGALFFYSRFKFVFECLPLLLAAKAAGEDARVVTVLSAGKGIPISLDDPYMKNLTAIKEVIGGGATRNSLACEAFAAKYPEISFIHSYPGFVKTNFGKNFLIFRIYSAITAPFTDQSKYQTIEESGEMMMRALWDPAYSRGAHHLWENADELPRDKLYLDTPGQREAMWDHLVESLHASPP